ncbi:MAG: hypothetical protein K0B37_14920, partial [Bacteroidales bacterium]|nr:hypothetical protein [Bacteroidales bacterium]
MNKLKVLIIIIPIFLTFESCFQNEWKEYNYDAHNFKIKFYHEPEVTEKVFLFHEDTLKSFLFEVSVADSLHENNYYSLTVTTYPSGYIHSDSAWTMVEDFMNSTQNEFFELDGLTLITSSLTEKKGYPGKIFKWKNNTSNMFFECHIFLAGNTLYRLLVMANEGQNHNIFINKYVESFDFYNIPDGNFSIPKTIHERTFSIEFPQKPVEEFRTLDSEYGHL